MTDTSSDDDVWRVTVAHGKLSHVVAFRPQHPQRVAFLKREVEKLTGVAVQHQRLLYRGKELLAEDDGEDGAAAKAPAAKKRSSQAPPLVDNAKLMLLLNGAYHQEAAKRPAPVRAASVDEPSSASSAAEASEAPPVKKQQVAIDTDSLDDDEVLVQALRGKANYELILKREDVVMAVKERVSGVLGLAPQGIRLVVRGKTPRDDARLSELLGTSATGAQSIKCMVLLQAQQHAVLEKEDDLRQLLNELTQLQVEAKRLEKQVARNFASREETAIRVGALSDGAQRVCGNLELLLDHLSPSGSGNAKPRASEQTTELLAKAIEDSKALSGASRALLRRLTLL